MNINQFKSFFSEQLEKNYPKEESLSFFYLLSEHLLSKTRMDIALHPNELISDDQLTLFHQAIEQLKQQIPIQYIIGNTEFYGLPFDVNSHVLIPRPETEELVQWVLDDFKNSSKKSHQILDIGTGSGCIPISIAKNTTNNTFDAIDISIGAITTAKNNALKNNVAINFIHKDILSVENLDSHYDIIISNPPYVRNLEKVEIQKNVLEHEPHTALFVEDHDALIFYKKISELAIKALSPNGILYFEINQYLGKETIDMMKQVGFSSIELKKDFLENDRMIKATI